MNRIRHPGFLSLLSQVCPQGKLNRHSLPSIQRITFQFPMQSRRLNPFCANRAGFCANFGRQARAD